MIYVQGTHKTSDAECYVATPLGLSVFLEPTGTEIVLLGAVAIREVTDLHRQNQLSRDDSRAQAGP